MKKIIAVILTLATLLVLAPAASAESLEEKQQAVVQTAIAYHLNNPYQQYDSIGITDEDKYKGGNCRENQYVAPEACTPDQVIYTVCSSYCFEVYYDTFDYKLLGTQLDAITGKLYKNVPEDMVVLRYNGEKDREALAAKAMTLLQPGDICVGISNSSGHAMLYVGDITGDGVPDILHSTGKKISMSTGSDIVEENGNIKLTDAKSHLQEKYFLKDQWIIIRPLQGEVGSLPLTESAKGRMKYPWLRYDRTVSTHAFGSVPTGGELTYSIAVSNHSKNAYTLPVDDTVPAGTELVKADGATVSGDRLSWSVPLAAGEEKTVSFTVKVTAPRGTMIVAEGGHAGGIPSNRLETRVGGKPLPGGLTTEKVQTCAKAGGTAAEVAERIYQTAYQIPLDLPTVKEMYKNLTEKAVYSSKKLKQNDDSLLRQMLVHRYFGGMLLLTESNNDRVLNFRISDLTEGDLIFATKIPVRDEEVTLYVRTADGVVRYESGKAEEIKENMLDKLLLSHFFLCLRPTLAYDDVTAMPPALKFTDVAQTDWYYSFVQELYGKGIVSGMTETTFVPNGTLTWGQALKLLTCGLGKGEQAATGAHWASGYLDYAKSQKWLDKDEDLNGPISRLAFCQIAAKAKDLTAQPAANPFKDCADKDVLALVNAGIISGMSADTFAPDKTLTRAQISKIICGLIK